MVLWAHSFRGNGRTEYSYEMLHFIHNLTSVWLKPIRCVNLLFWLRETNNMFETGRSCWRIGYWIHQAYQTDLSGWILCRITWIFELRCVILSSLWRINEISFRFITKGEAQTLHLNRSKPCHCVLLPSETFRKHSTAHSVVTKARNVHHQTPDQRYKVSWIASMSTKSTEFKKGGWRARKRCNWNGATKPNCKRKKSVS